MKINKTVYKYIEYELYHYEQYKEEIQLERERILESSSTCMDGMPRGNAVGNPTERKGINLVESTSILAMQRIIRAIDNTLKRLTPTHKRIFDMCYMEGRNDRIKMSNELHVSYETFNRYKTTLIACVAKELGINI